MQNAMTATMQPRMGRPARDYVLGTPQYLSMILAHLAPHWTKDLYNAALVCKSWNQPALDIKWTSCLIRLSRILGKLDPKMKIDPNDLVSKRARSETTSSLT